MIYTILVVSVVLTLVFHVKKLEWKGFDDKSIRYFLHDKTFEFFLSLTIVSLFYSVLYAWAGGMTDQTTLAELENFERLLVAIQDYASYFKLAPWHTAAAILGLLVADLIIARYRNRKARLNAGYHPAMDPILASDSETKSLVDRFKTYHTWTKRVYVILVLMGSFTFFGNEAGEKIAELRIRTDDIKVGYGKVQEEAEQMLNAAVQQQLYDKAVRESLRDNWDFRDYPSQFADAVVDLRIQYEAIRVYNVADPKADELLKRYQRFESSAKYSIENTVRIDDPKPAEPAKRDTAPAAKSPPPETSARSIENTRFRIAASNLPQKRLVPLLKLGGGKELLCQFPRSLTDLLKSMALAQIIKSYPILEPVFDVFVGSFDKAVDEKVKRAADTVADSMLNNHPGKVEEVIQHEAKKIVDTVEVKPSPTVAHRIKSFTARIKAQLAEIRTAAKELRARLEILKIDGGGGHPFDELKDLIEPPPDDPTVECYCVGRHGRTYLGRPC